MAVDDRIVYVEMEYLCSDNHDGFDGFEQYQHKLLCTVPTIYTDDYKNVLN